MSRNIYGLIFLTKLSIVYGDMAVLAEPFVQRHFEIKLNPGREVTWVFC